MIGYIITIILSVVSGLLVFILQSVIRENRQLHKQRKQESVETDQALRNGVLSLLRIQLIEYHDKYMIRDNIPFYIYENWDDMFKSYESLGGNGTIKHMNDEIKSARVRSGDMTNEDH